MQRCAEGFNSGVKGLNNVVIALTRNIHKSFKCYICFRRIPPGLLQTVFDRVILKWLQTCDRQGWIDKNS
jgi:hypothetical protein